jgi:1,4-dihydroxy-2-naphthoate octaprenyltransferase
MKKDSPSILQMIRAPFLSSIIAPLITGTLLCVKINGFINIPGFILVLITGIGLHTATNVYNDIYDTIQGADIGNAHRNEFSGGSGVLQNHPEMMERMYLIARIGLLTALCSTAGLMYFVDKELWIYLWGLFIVSAFFSKYYTAAPVKLAYRGLGEISVWLSFGPMAVLIAAISQNISFNSSIIMLMPLSGLSTLSILLVGQMIDIDADRAAGKHGAASRLGTRMTASIYVTIQLAVIANVLYISVFFKDNAMSLMMSLIPYAMIFPVAALVVLKYHNNPAELKRAAKMTVQMHMLFSVLLIAGFIIYLFM